MWKADRALADIVRSSRIGEFGAALAGVPGLRLIQDNAIWQPPSGKALLCHQDAAYLDFLDPKNMTTCWMALDDTAADTGTIFYVRGSNHWPLAKGGEFHAPDDWLAHIREAMPEGEELELVPIEVPAGGAFHDGWTFHGSPANERADAERRAIISHTVSQNPLERERRAAPDLLEVPAPRGARARRRVLPGAVNGLTDPGAAADCRGRCGSRHSRARSALAGPRSPPDGPERSRCCAAAR